MIKYAVVRWAEEAVEFHKIKDHELAGEFYAILAAKKNGRKWSISRSSLLYLGLAYGQKIRDRIRQEHRSYQLVSDYFSKRRRETDLIVVAGRLVREVSRVGRITRQFAEDVEALLIFENQPKFNSKYKYKHGDRPLVVVNIGSHFPLKHVAKSSASALTRWEKEGGREAVQGFLHFEDLSAFLAQTGQSKGRVG